MKNLPMGTALITSENLERPVITNIRVRRSKHGGTAVDLIKTKQASVGGRSKIPVINAIVPPDTPGITFAAPIAKPFKTRFVYFFILCFILKIEKRKQIK